MKLEKEKKIHYFIDDCATYYIYLPRSKNKALQVFNHYNNKVENQLRKKKLKMVKSNGGECKRPFIAFCS